MFSVRDPRSGATSDTVLEQLLRARGVERIVLVGWPRLLRQETVLAPGGAASGPRWSATASGPSTGTPGDGERALDEMIRAGATLS